MTGDEYKNLAMRTNDGLGTPRLTEHLQAYCHGTVNYDIAEILNGCLGLSGETGEFNDMIKKWVFHEASLDLVHARKELGDILWYVALVCNGFGWSLDEIMEMNIEKLKKRYPEGFSRELSAHRTQDDI